MFFSFQLGCLLYSFASHRKKYNILQDFEGSLLLLFLSVGQGSHEQTMPTGAERHAEKNAFRSHSSHVGLPSKVFSREPRRPKWKKTFEVALLYFLVF